ncbi:MAG: AbrB/MazE/SpoVT family DNA-binding domain-containing protein [Deltaproteobacteria bacterium]|nr:AbrB/MazE/SpoVT family DNA-binding domain-containing protein [Deltaproteobacteria bacterium]
MLAKKTSKNQLTLPKEIADRFPGTEYFDVQVKGRAILLRPVRIEAEGERSGIDAIREKIRKLRLTEKDVAKAVRWARNRP